MKSISYIGGVILFICGCTGLKTEKEEAPVFPAFDMQGHRGARGLMPENTVPAMIHAIDLGVTTIEMDCHITQDDQVVVTHDDAINPAHSLKPDGSEMEPKKEQPYIIYQMPYDSIRKFDIGSKYYDAFPDQKKQSAYIPLLAELIDSVQAHLEASGKPQVFYNIETKSKVTGDGKYHPDPATFVHLLMDVIEEKGIAPWVVIQSFDVRTLQVMHEDYPDIAVSLIVSNKKTLDENIKELGFTPDFYSANYKLVDAELVEQCHQQGIKITPWTVNDKAKIEELKELGVDGIISDYPNLFFND